MTNENEFDALLHDALSEYREAEPLVGMEARLLQRIAKANGEHKVRWLRWVVATACAAVVAVAIWAGIARRPIETHAPDSMAIAKPAEQAPAQAPAPLVSAPVVTARRATKPVRTPMPLALAAEVQTKPAVFPLPVRLTADEQALMAVLQRDPKAAPSVPEESDAMTIAEIEIKPLSIVGISSENSGEKQ